MHRFSTVSPFPASFSSPFAGMDLLFEAMRPRASVPQRQRASFRGGELRLEDGEEAFVLRARLPGIASEALELNVGDDWIELSAKRENEAPEGYEVLRRERSSYAFSRRVALPKRVDAEAVEAVLRDGLLTVTLPKQSESAPRQITIEAA